MNLAHTDRKKRRSGSESGNTASDFTARESNPRRTPLITKSLTTTPSDLRYFIAMDAVLVELEYSIELRVTAFGIILMVLGTVGVFLPSVVMVRYA